MTPNQRRHDLRNLTQFMDTRKSAPDWSGTIQIAGQHWYCADDYSIARLKVGTLSSPPYTIVVDEDLKPLLECLDQNPQATVRYVGHLIVEWEGDEEEAGSSASFYGRPRDRETEPDLAAVMRHHLDRSPLVMTSVGVQADQLKKLATLKEGDTKTGQPARVVGQFRQGCVEITTPASPDFRAILTTNSIHSREASTNVDAGTEGEQA